MASQKCSRFYHVWEFRLIPSINPQLLLPGASSSLWLKQWPAPPGGWEAWGGPHLGWCHLSFFFGSPSLSVLWGSSYRCTPAFVSRVPAAGDSAWLQHNRLDELQKTLQTDWITNSIRWCLACQRFHSPLRASVLSAHLAAHSVSPRHMHL